MMSDVSRRRDGEIEDGEEEKRRGEVAERRSNGKEEQGREEETEILEDREIGIRGQGQSLTSIP
jgi:hypothetical protein